MVLSVFCNKEDVFWNIKLLVIVCKLGYLEIVVVLLKVGVNVNLNDVFYILLIVVCENGYLNIV